MTREIALDNHCSGAVMSTQEAAITPLVAKSSDARPAVARGSLRRWAVPVAGLLALAVAALYVIHGRHFEDTDDAEIDGDISAVSPRVSGTVIAVHVVDNEHVAAGAPLLEIDPADYEVALEQARANLEQAEAQLAAEEPGVYTTEVSTRTAISTSGSDVATAQAELTSAERDLDQLRAQLVQAEASDRFAQLQYDRGQRLLGEQAIAQADFDQRQSTAKASSASVESLRQALASANGRIEQRRARLHSAESRSSEARLTAPRQVETRQATVAVRKANIAAARAQLRQAELNLQYTKVLAPVDGIVGKKSVNVGDRVTPGQQLFALTQTARLWVTANFRETQLRHMQPHQPVDMHVDAIGLDLHGTIESIAAATGSRYSLLPPENASGNYVKVVQRLPVRIALAPHQPGLERLRPGMSVEPTVTVR
jgi:membrane fusion protein (multidrug efflux system)